jgi:hypothetical protein
MAEPAIAPNRPIRGYTLTVRFTGFDFARIFIERVVRADCARCDSPEREEFCEKPAARVYYQDCAEWYACCPDHFPEGEQWCGSTPFLGLVEMLIIPGERFDVFRASWTEAERRGIKVTPYYLEEADGV